MEQWAKRQQLLATNTPPCGNGPTASPQLTPDLASERTCDPHRFNRVAGIGPLNNPGIHTSRAPLFLPPSVLRHPRNWWNRRGIDGIHDIIVRYGRRCLQERKQRRTIYRLECISAHGYLTVLYYLQYGLSVINYTAGIPGPFTSPGQWIIITLRSTVLRTIFSFPTVHIIPCIGEIRPTQLDGTLRLLTGIAQDQSVCVGWLVG